MLNSPSFSHTECLFHFWPVPAPPNSMNNLPSESSPHDFRHRLIPEIRGKNCLTNFHGMDFTSDEFRFLVRKWQTLIERYCENNRQLSPLAFAITFTKRRLSQVRRTTYAQSSQIHGLLNNVLYLQLVRFHYNELITVEHLIICYSCFLGLGIAHNVILWLLRTL